MISCGKLIFNPAAVYECVFQRVLDYFGCSNLIVLQLNIIRNLIAWQRKSLKASAFVSGHGAKRCAGTITHAHVLQYAI